MADDNTTQSVLHVETIKLNKLKPNEYPLWAVQAEATFEVYKCLNIVLGKEAKPTPVNEAKPLESLGTEVRAQVLSWETRHALAREALLRSLGPTDLIKVIPVKDSAPAIWSRLKDEYGKSFDFEYLRVNAEFQNLRKDQKTTMKDHINKFNALLQEVDYKRPAEIAELGRAAINLYFLHSLGRDWEAWAMAKGESIRTSPTAELMDEVCILALRGASSISQPSESSTSLSQSQEMKAQVSRFNGGCHSQDHHKSGNSGKWRRNGRGSKDNFGNSSNNNQNHGRKPSYDPNTYCSVHQRVGHDIFQCRKMARDQKRGRNGGNSNAGNSGNISRQTRSESYQPSFIKPSYPYSTNTINHTVNLKVTRLIDVNNSGMPDLSTSVEDSDRLLDSAADAYITPYRSDLPFYTDVFVGQVKGFVGYFDDGTWQGIYEWLLMDGKLTHARQRLLLSSKSRSDDNKLYVGYLIS